MRNFQSKPLDFLLHLTFFLLLLFPTLSHAADLHSICSNTTNYTANSTVGANLKQVLSVLTFNALSSTYFYVDKGDDPAIACGLFVCRGDITTDQCSTCVDQASQEIEQECHMTTDAVIWYDYCMLRYSDRRFKSAYDPAYNSMLLMWNVANASDPQQFNAALNRLMNNISLVAAYDPSVQKFATGEANSSINQTIYGLVQCTQDLTNDNCNECLQDAISKIPKYFDGKIGGQVLGANCIWRFEVYRFYYESSAAPTAGHQYYQNSRPHNEDFWDENQTVLFKSSDTLFEVTDNRWFNSKYKHGASVNHIVLISKKGDLDHKGLLFL